MDNLPNKQGLTVRAVFLAAVIAVPPAMPNAYLCLSAALTVTVILRAAVLAALLRPFRGGIPGKLSRRAINSVGELAAAVLIIPAVPALFSAPGFQTWTSMCDLHGSGITGKVNAYQFRYRWLATVRRGLMWTRR